MSIILKKFIKFTVALRNARPQRSPPHNTLHLSFFVAPFFCIVWVDGLLVDVE